MTTKPNTCPHCGAPLKSSRVCSWGTLEVYTCGKTFDDGPGAPCGNRDERTTRDETTQPHEAEEPEAMSQTAETAPTQDVVVYPEVSTLPAIKPLADAALERLGLAVATVQRLRSYKDLVLADLTDKKGAKDLTEKRLEVKRFRTAWVRECKDGREEANAISKGWNNAEKALAEPFEEIEEHLAAQVEAHEREVARIAKEAETARQAKIQARLDAMTAAGIPVDLVRATEMDDATWSDYLAKALDAKVKLDAATAIADELAALGDECTPGEALQLTEEQIEHRLGVARKADHDRREAQRIKDEEAAAEALRIETERQRVAAEEKAARERLERGYRRGRELALLGAIGHEVEPLADMTEEAFQVALETARQEKADRDARIAEERRIQAEKDAELARLKKDEAEADAKAAREEAAREVRHHGAPSFAIDPIAPAVVDAVQAVESQEITEALEEPWPTIEIQTEREKIAAWARAVLDGMPSTPVVTDAELLRTMRNTVEGVRSMLLDLEKAVGA